MELYDKLFLINENHITNLVYQPGFQFYKNQGNKRLFYFSLQTRLAP